MRLKSKDNVFIFSSKRHQFIHNFSIGIVGLNPDFTSNKVKMKNHIMDEIFLLIPSDADQLVMMSFRICEYLVLDIRPERGFNGSIFFQ